MVAEDKRVLLKKYVQSIAADLEKMDWNDLFRHVCTDVGNGYHKVLYIASVHGRLWSNFSKHMQGWIIQCCTSYRQNLKPWAKYKEKFAQLQTEWMGMIRSVLHEQPASDSTAATVPCAWESLVNSTDLEDFSDGIKSRIPISSIGSSENFKSPVFIPYSASLGKRLCASQREHKPGRLHWTNIVFM